MLVPIAAAAGVVIFFLFLAVVARNYHKVPPSLVAVVSGRRRIVERQVGDQIERTSVGFRVVRGGAFFLIPILERVDYLSLQAIPIQLAIRGAYTKEGVPVTVEAVANVKIDSAQESLINAAERFLGKTLDEVRDFIFQTLEGHLRAILGTLTVEEINANRQSFGQKVSEEAALDLRRMGIAIDTIVIQTIGDETGYLDSLGKRRTAEVKRDATIGEAEAMRDANVRSALARQEGEQARLAADQQIAGSERDLGVKKADFSAEVAAAQATAAQQGPLAQARAEQNVIAEKTRVKEVETERMTEVAVKQARRREQELVAEVVKPAEAQREAARINADGTAIAAVRTAEGQRDAAIASAEGDRKRIEQLAEAERARLIAVAEGNAAQAQKMGEAQGAADKAAGEGAAAAQRAKLLAEAEGTKAKLLAEAEGKRAALLAEAEGLQKKADAYKAFNQAAVLQTVLEKLPGIIEATEKPVRAFGDAIAEPLGAIDKVTIVDVGGGDGKGIGGMQKLAGIVPGVLAQLAESARAVGLRMPALDKVIQVGEVKDVSSSDE